MDKNGERHKTVLAYVMFFINIIMLLYSGYAVANHDARHNVKFPEIPDGMYLTINKELSLESDKKEIIVIPEGAVVMPASIHVNRVYFYYSRTGKGFNEFKRLDALERMKRSEEMGMTYLSAIPDCFEEQKQLEKIIEEAKKTTRSMQSSVFWKDFLPTMFIGLGALLFGFFIMFLLTENRLFVLAYVINVIFFFIILLSPGAFLYR